MTREWTPGDVAMLRCDDTDCDVTEHPGILGKTGEWWLLDLGEYAMSKDVEPWRPLVVIDPEDREQVERLTQAYYDARGHGPHSSFRINGGDFLQAALREFADPTPPKPEEPSGLGAVVEDDAGELWIRRDTPSGAPWINAKGNAFPVSWPSINAVRVLSPGYDPEAES